MTPRVSGFGIVIHPVFPFAVTMPIDPPVPPPNIVVVLVDDLGRADYSAFGTPDIRTPHIDRLIREGAEFRNFYANSPVCSPTRASLLSGCYPDRVGVPGVIRDDEDNSWGYLAPCTLLPQALRPAGYHSALIGKWHLGLEAPNLPNDRGFDFFHGFLGDMMDDYWTHRRNGQNFMRRNQEVIHPTGHATDLFTDWACDYINERHRAGGPFCLYLAYNAPHNPIQPPAEWLEQVRRRELGISDARARIVALIEHLDDGIGRVLSTLDRLDIAKNTVVIFMSDNGGVLRFGANNGPWRSDKTHTYEGGLRVPAAVRWPGQVTAGLKLDRTTLTMDVLPTLCDIAGVSAPAGIDGVSFLPVLRGLPDDKPDREYYFVRREGRAGRNIGGKTVEALIHRGWKLVHDDPFAPMELFHLEQDPYEAINLREPEPEKFDDLAARVRRHIRRGGEVPWQPPRR